MISRVFSESFMAAVRAAAWRSAMARIIAAARRRPREPAPQPRRRLDAGAAGDRAVRQPRPLAVAPRGREAGDARRRRAGAVAARRRSRWRWPPMPHAPRAYDWAAGAGEFDARGPLCCSTTSSATAAPACACTASSCREQARAAAGRPGLAAAAGRSRAAAMPRCRRAARTARPAGAAAVDRPGAGPRRCGTRRRRLADDARRCRPRSCRAPACPCRWRRACCAWIRRCRSATRATSTCCPTRCRPRQHRGYAVQWFALALAVLVTALILTFRKAAQP